MAYQRYMVFYWTEYDNVPPFQCIDSSYDDLDEAKAKAKKLKEDDDDGSCVFDRVKGVII